jgi:uncharacterized RDD family membrane protein YckC
MMNNLPREKLKDIITQYGRSLADDPQRCEALLRDYYGQYRKEINVLISAMKEGIPTDLIDSQNSTPSELLLARLTKKLEAHLGLSQESAKWAVESWGLALGIILDLGRNTTPPLVVPQYQREESTVPVQSTQTTQIMQYPVLNPKSIAFNHQYYQPRHGSLGDNKKRLIIKRFFSLIIDSIVLATFVLMLYLMMILVNYSINPSLRDENLLRIIQALTTTYDRKSWILARIWMALSSILVLIYFTVLQSSISQATWGEQCCKIIVTNIKGTKITAWQAFRRTFIAMFFIIYWPLGVFNFCFGLNRRDGRCLHDIWSGTRTTDKNG